MVSREDEFGRSGLVKERDPALGFECLGAFVDDEHVKGSIEDMMRASAVECTENYLWYSNLGYDTLERVQE